jgi:hypothetical protein
MLLSEDVEGCGDVALVASGLNMNFYTKRARRFVHVLQLIFEEGVVGIEKYSDQIGFWNKFVQEINRLLSIWGLKKLTPVRLPPGRLSRATRPD